jgi:hypothetical protein
MIWLSEYFDFFMQNLLRIGYEKILLFASVNLREDYLLTYSGLFSEVKSHQLSGSGWGVDLMTKSHAGEWIPWEMKANGSRLSNLQKRGATEYVNLQLQRTADEYRNWKGANDDMKSFAERVKNEQAKFNLLNGFADMNPRKPSFKGCIIRSRDILDKDNVKTSIHLWDRSAPSGGPNGAAGSTRRF